jgi:hypothetical protein
VEPTSARWEPHGGGAARSHRADAGHNGSRAGHEAAQEDGATLVGSVLGRVHRTVQDRRVHHPR